MYAKSPKKASSLSRARGPQGECAACAQDWFAAFVLRHADGNGRLHPLLELKSAHSRRVGALCAELSAALNWCEEHRRAAGTLGLLHDAGRFPQFHRYGTFQDRLSVDHGRQGRSILETERVLSAFAPRERAAVLSAVAGHNARDLAEGLDPLSLSFLKLVRDADKLDILHVCTHALRTGEYRNYPELFSRLDPAGPPSPDLVEEIRRRRAGSYERIRSLLDFRLVGLAWVYDINYVPALRMFVDRGLLAGILEGIPEGSGAEDLAADAQQYVRQRLNRTP